MAKASDLTQTPDMPHAGHGHGHGHGHNHTTGGALASDSTDALRVVTIATIGMFIVAAVELIFFGFSQSAGLLSDALHNLGDVLTTIALGAAFLLSRRPANLRYTYGFHRAEDLAGAFIALVITVSGIAAAYESYQRLISHAVPTQIGWGIAAALFGFVGNEALAQYKTRQGQRLNSESLIADGQHSRADGVTSLAAAAGLLLTAFGVRQADPIAGLLISVAILYILVEVGRDVLGRLLDAVDPALIAQIHQQAQAVPGVLEVSDIRARWAGRRLYIAFNLGADAALTLAQAHEIAEMARQEILTHVSSAASVDVHVDPVGLPSDEDPHRWKHPASADTSDADDHDHDHDHDLEHHHDRDQEQPHTHGDEQASGYRA